MRTITLYINDTQKTVFAYYRNKLQFKILCGTDSIKTVNEGLSVAKFTASNQAFTHCKIKDNLW